MTPEPAERDHRVAVVSDACGPIGEALCRALVARSTRTVMLDRNEQHLRGLRKRVGAEAFTATHRTTPTDAFDLVEARSTVLEEFGPPDLVITGSAQLSAAPFEMAIPAEWQDMLDANIKAVLQMTQTFSGDLLECAARGWRSDLVLLGATHPHFRQRDYAVFAAISAAIAQLSRSLRAEFGPRGVRIHYVAPFFTERIEPRVGAADQMRRSSNEVSLIEPERIAELIIFTTGLPVRANLAEVAISPMGTL